MWHPDIVTAEHAARAEAADRATVQRMRRRAPRQGEGS